MHGGGRGITCKQQRISSNGELYNGEGAERRQQWSSSPEKEKKNICFFRFFNNVNEKLRVSLSNAAESNELSRASNGNNRSEPIGVGEGDP